MELFNQSLRDSKRLGALDLVYRIYNEQGNLAYHRGQYREALELYKRCFAIARRMGETSSAAVAALNTGNMHMNLGEVKEAYPHLQFASFRLGTVTHKTSAQWDHWASSLVLLSEICRQLDLELQGVEAIEKLESLLSQHSFLNHYTFWLWLEKTQWAKWQGRSEVKIFLMKTRELIQDDQQREQWNQVRVKCGFKEEEDVVQTFQNWAGKSTIVPHAECSVQSKPKFSYQEDMTWADYEGAWILKALERSRGKKKVAAKMLGITPTTLRYKLASPWHKNPKNSTKKLAINHLPSMTLREFRLLVFKAAFHQAKRNSYRAIDNLKVSPRVFFPVMSHFSQAEDSQSLDKTPEFPAKT
jgi:tetratricopeptide (TPR) repeat protein